MSDLTTRTQRLQSIDLLRGLVIVLMLLDHVRETFFLHLQVSDPMDVASTEADLFFSRFAAHLCAPVFVFLTGLSAFLYGEKQSSKSAIASFLLKRGLFLVILEVTLVNFAWTFQFPPSKLFLQVIWAIGLSMIALSALIYLPRWLLASVGLIIVAGHNLLDGIHFARDSVFYIPWSILHEKNWIEFSEHFKLRTTYPVLPWIGVIALGYVAGPWFAKAYDAATRRRNLLISSGLLIIGFVVLRCINCYGDTPYVQGATFLKTFMSFINITKYPPSLLFISLTLGIGLLLLIVLERYQQVRGLKLLAVFGSVPMFFYLLHLYVLKFLYIAAVGIWGTNQGDYFGFDHVWILWICTPLLVVALYPVVKWFSQLKACRRDIKWLKYF